MLKLFTDTDTDITPEMAKEYGYELISMPYSADGNTVYPYVDFDSFDSHTFYDMLRAGALPTTSALGKEAYIEYFEPHFRNGDDILYVHFSRGMTATFDAMDKAVSELKEKYPDGKVVVCSAHNNLAMQRKALESGADMFLPKPLVLTRPLHQGCLQERIKWN